MRNIILSRCLLITSIVITILALESSSQDICRTFKKLGFKNKDPCSNNIFKTAKNKFTKAMTKVGEKVTSVVADIVFKANGISKLYLPVLSKKILTFTLINQEPGFDLTTEEIAKFNIWENGIIPFFIEEYSFDKVLRDRIRIILDEVNSSTGVQFTEIPSPPNDENERYVLFINRRGVLRCVDHTANNFTNQGVQRVVLGYDCIDLNAGMAALILTLLGVPPQHNSPNRDHYIEIMNDNIIPDKISFFQILANSDWLFHEVEYDFESASHYPYHMYSIRGGSTIRPKWHVDESGPVGEGKTFSINDILKIKMLYNYILKKSTKSKHSACSHMFQPGNAFSKYRQTLQSHINFTKPREKPAKYLGQDPFAALSQNEGDDIANNEGDSNDQETNNNQEDNSNQETKNIQDGLFQNNKLKEHYANEQAKLANKINKSISTDQEESIIDNKNSAIDNTDVDRNAEISPMILTERSSKEQKNQRDGMN